MGWEKPKSLIMKWRKWALQISLLIDEFWNSSQAHSRTADYKALTTDLLESLLWYAPYVCLPAMYMFTFRLQWKTLNILLHSTHAWWFTQVTMSTFLFSLQHVTATSMPDAVDSTWSCISCQGGRAEGSAWTAATTLRAATATTARRVFTETWPGRSLTDEPVKVRVQQKCSAAESTSSRCEFIYL